MDKDIMKLDIAINKFTKAMKDKCFLKSYEGESGWDNPNNKDYILKLLIIHVDKLSKGDENQYVDIANLAMFLWNLNENNLSIEEI